MDEYGPYIDAPGGDTILRRISCCIRLYPWDNPDTEHQGPQIHANSAHIATGIASVEIGDDGYLWVHHAESLQVSAIQCSTDETLAMRDISVGGSGGTNYTRVAFCHGGRLLPLNDPDVYAVVAGTASNLWYSVDHVVQRNSGGKSVEERLSAVEANVDIMTILDRLRALEQAAGSTL